MLGFISNAEPTASWKYQPEIHTWACLEPLHAGWKRKLAVSTTSCLIQFLVNRYLIASELTIFARDPEKRKGIVLKCLDLPLFAHKEAGWPEPRWGYSLLSFWQESPPSIWGVTAEQHGGTGKSLAEKAWAWSRQLAFCLMPAVCKRKLIWASLFPSSPSSHAHIARWKKHTTSTDCWRNRWTLCKVDGILNVNRFPLFSGAWSAVCVLVLQRWKENAIIKVNRDKVRQNGLKISIGEAWLRCDWQLCVFV